jgi:putative N6-adenine-specific DNA methylase
MAAGIPPGINRRFAFMDWPGYSSNMWKKMTAQANEKISAQTGTLIGSDRDEGAVRMSQENAERAGVSKQIEFRKLAISAIAPPAEAGSAKAGWIVTNPPYGQRVSAGLDLRDLYTSLGKALLGNFADWHVSFLCDDDMLATRARLVFSKGLSLNNGGIPVKLFRGVVPAAKNKNIKP